MCKKKLTFIENLCFHSLKISGASKNCRLKILVRVRVYARIYARMYARASDCGQIIIRTHDRNTTGTRPEKPEYICMIADN